MHDIRQVKGHYEVYSNGKFWFSADSMEEVKYELEQERSFHEGNKTGSIHDHHDYIHR